MANTETIKTEQPTCPDCGSPLKQITSNLFGIKRSFWVKECNCYDKKVQTRKEAERKEYLKDKFKSANVGERYLNITLDKLETLKTEHIIDARNFVNTFDSKKSKSLHLIGKPGNGKTSIANAIIKDLTSRNYDCRYITWSDFKQRWDSSKSFTAKSNTTEMMRWLRSFDLVVLDEFIINTKDEKEINLASDLLDSWYRNKKVFILINNPCDIEEMKKIKRLEKSFDRLREQADKWFFEHDSYRIQVYGGTYD